MAALRLTLVLSVMVLLILGLPRTSHAQRSLPDEDLAIPLALLAYDSTPYATTGTGFFVNQPDGMYLVTAKHVIYDDKNNLRLRLDVRGLGIDVRDTTPLLLEIDLPRLASGGLLVPDRAQDIVVMKIGSTRRVETPERMFGVEGVKLTSFPRSPVVGVPPSQIKRFDDVLISNPVLIFGFPTNLGLSGPVFLARPLLRRGIVAGKDDPTKTIVIDALVHGGNSGGPVFQIEEQAVRRGFVRIFSVIGVVKGYIPTVLNGNTSNSGYTIVVPMDHVLETVDRLEKRNP